METILVQVKSNRALKLLKNLEALNVIKLLHGKSTSNSGEGTMASFRGSISKQTADALEDYVTTSRNEWSR